MILVSFRRTRMGAVSFRAACTDSPLRHLEISSECTPRCQTSSGLESCTLFRRRLGFPTYGRRSCAERRTDFELLRPKRSCSPSPRTELAAEAIGGESQGFSVTSLVVTCHVRARAAAYNIVRLLAHFTCIFIIGIDSSLMLG